MQMVQICEIFGWDYQTYINQPQWFIDLVKDKLKKDSEKQSKK
jgi:hypothetical protein